MASRAARVAPQMSALEDLKSQATDLNPIVGFWDPLNLSEGEFWGETNENTIGFLRQAEIKHGRVAMFGFVGFIVHANGITWPWKMTLAGDDFPSVASAPEAWDAIPLAAKWQIILMAAFFEVWQENSALLEKQGEKHYMRGGKPGVFPDFVGNTPHPVPFNLFDPFKLSKNKTPEQKARGRNIEINNGRLAMIGLFGFLSESKVPGSVPALTSLNLPVYKGDFMIPFEGDFSYATLATGFPVAQM